MPPAPLKPLRRWIWRAFLRSALIPLVLVESVLIGVYLYTNESIRESQIGYLQTSALQDLDSAVRREGQVIDSRLRAIEAQVGAPANGHPHCRSSTGSKIGEHVSAANGPSGRLINRRRH